MKLKSILFVSAIGLATQTNAQTWVEDSVEMGANYANDIYYDLATGNGIAVDASNWHLAFQMTSFGEPSFAAAVRANHIKGHVEVYSLHLSANTSFATLSATDTVGKTDPTMQQVNVDTTNWGNSAFIQNRDASNPSDFGWGLYQGQPDHNLLGDSIYLVKVNGVAYKLWLKEYVSMGGNSVVGYKFEIGLLDGSSPSISNYIKRQNYTDRLFAYYNITTNTVLDREPSRGAWNLLFTQYPKPLIFGQSGLQAYTGVLSNDTLEVAEVQADPNLVTSSNYTSYYTNPTMKMNEIGDNWKSFDMSTFTYNVDTMKSWIIKTPTAYYQLGFTRFDGGSGGMTGKSIFRTRLLATTTTGVNNIDETVSMFGLYPNPATNDANIVIDVKERISNAQLFVTDLTGKVVYNRAMTVNKGLNGYAISTANLANGNYIVTITNGLWKAAQKLVVQH